MSLPNYSETLNTLISSTIQIYAEQGAVDQIFAGSVLLQELRSRGCVRPLDGGTHIRVPVEYARSPVQSMHYKESLRMVPVEIITTAIYNWKYIGAQQMIYLAELALNQGRARILNMLEESTQNVEQSLSEALNVMLFGDGTGNNGKDFLGLRALVDNASVLGGLDPATFDWWRSYVDQTTATITFEQISKALTQATWNNRSPNLIITTLDIWQKLHDTLPAQQRFIDERVAQWGFSNFVVRGNVPVVMDRHCPNGFVFVLNSNFLRLVHHRDYFFKPFEFVRLPNAAIQVAFWFTMGNFITTSRRVHGVLKNKTV